MVPNFDVLTAKLYTILFLMGLFQWPAAMMAQDSIPEKNIKTAFPVVPYQYSLHFSHTDTSLNFGRAVVEDVYSIAKSPFKWKGKDWRNAGIITATAGLLYAFDEPLYTSLDGLRGETAHHLSTYFFDPIGDYRYHLVAMGGLYTIGCILDDTKTKNVAILTGEAILITGALTQVVKLTTGRQRPVETDPLNPYMWKGWNNHSSFWSGHAATAFSVASVMSGIYKDKLWVSLTSYSLASTVCLVRVIEEQHWPSDVFVGAVVGTAIGKLVVYNYKSRAVKITPYSTGLITGVLFRYAFK